MGSSSEASARVGQVGQVEQVGDDE